LDISLNLFLMRRMGIAGIALSTSLVLFASFVFLGICAVKLFPEERLLVSAAAGGVREKA
jgi:Na+-driven multidrug efflux pump